MKKYNIYITAFIASICFGLTSCGEFNYSEPHEDRTVYQSDREATEVNTTIADVKAYVPEGTYLLWLDFSAYGLTAQELRRRLVEEAGVALNAGTDYGAAYGAYARLNAATPRSILTEGLEKIAKAFGD